MRVLTNYLRLAPARLTANRALVAAMLLGPVIGAMVAVATVAAEETKAPNTITIDNFTFTPKELTVAVGTTVTWANHDDIPHNVVSDDKSFKSKALDTDDNFSFTFTKPGTYSYFCSIHPKMTGKIVVQ